MSPKTNGLPTYAFLLTKPPVLSDLSSRRKMETYWKHSYMCGLLQVACLVLRSSKLIWIFLHWKSCVLVPRRLNLSPCEFLLPRGISCLGYILWMEMSTKSLRPYCLFIIYTWAILSMASLYSRQPYLIL